MRRKRIKKFFVTLYLCIIAAFLICIGITFSGIFKLRTAAYSEAVILDAVIVFNQHPDYPTGCESVALYILLQYYDVDVTVDEIIDVLPKGPLPYEYEGIRYGANPEREFVGNPLDDNSYGVYNGPIAETAEYFKSGAIAEYGMSVKRIKSVIRNGNPVIAWTNIIPDADLCYSAFWQDYETGEEVAWPSGEHAVVIYGYDDSGFYISNPYDGEKYHQSYEIFEKNYDQMGQRVVYYS